MDITDGDVLLARLVSRADLGRAGLNFFSEESDGIQVGTWNYEAGHALHPHIHNLVEKTTKRTAEVLYVIDGSIHADIYNEKAELVFELKLQAGDLLICLNGGHGYKILEDGTRVLEVKNGPYLGPELDRRRI
jgi:hypothetical protein